MASPKKKWLRMKALEDAALVNTEEQVLEIDSLVEQNDALEIIVIREEARLESVKAKTKAKPKSSKQNNKNNNINRKKNR